MVDAPYDIVDLGVIMEYAGETGGVQRSDPVGLEGYEESDLMAILLPQREGGFEEI